VLIFCDGNRKGNLFSQCLVWRPTTFTPVLQLFHRDKIGARNSGFKTNARLLPIYDKNKQSSIVCRSIQNYSVNLMRFQTYI